MGSNFSLKTRLLLLGAFMSVIPVVVGGFTFYGMREVAISYEKVTAFFQISKLQIRCT